MERNGSNDDALIDIATSNDDVGTLLLNIAAHDAAAFRKLYAATSAKLFGVLLRLLRDRAEAEDALQDVYLKVWLRSHQYDITRGRGIIWLTAVSRNHALSRLRARRDRHTGLEEVLNALPDPGHGAEARLMYSDDARWVVACLKKLRPEIALAIYDAYLSGLSYAEISKRHNLPVNTVRTHLRRGLLDLKRLHDARPM